MEYCTLRTELADSLMALGIWEKIASHNIRNSNATHPCFSSIAMVSSWSLYNEKRRKSEKEKMSRVLIRNFSRTPLLSYRNEDVSEDMTLLVHSTFYSAIRSFALISFTFFSRLLLFVVFLPTVKHTNRSDCSAFFSPCRSFSDSYLFGWHSAASFLLIWLCYSHWVNE